MSKGLDEILDTRYKHSSGGEDLVKEFDPDKKRAILEHIDELDLEAYINLHQHVGPHYLKEFKELIGEDQKVVPKKIRELNVTSGYTVTNKVCLTCKDMLEYDGIEITCQCEGRNKLRAELRKAADEKWGSDE